MGFAMARDWSRALWCLLCCGGVCVYSASSSDGEKCNVTISGPNPLFVQYGAPFTLNCDTTCNTTEPFHWETSLQKQKQTPETLGELMTTMDQWTTEPKCFIVISGTELPEDKRLLIAYVPPEEVTIAIPSVMEVGQSNFIHCDVRNVAPKRYLTVLIKRGNETLRTETYTDDSTDSSTDVTLSHTITAQREDNGGNYTCLALLDLRPNGKLFEKSSSKSVRTYALPKEIKITVPETIEMGSEVTAQCNATEAFPIEEMQLELAIADSTQTIKETLNLTEVERYGDTLTAKAMAPSREPTAYVLTCTARFGEISKDATQQVLIYSFPDPFINIEGNLTADTDVAINCTAPAASPEQILVNIGIGDTALCNGTSSLSCIYRVQKEHNGMNITCDVTQEETNISKRIRKTLNIFYAPEINNILCQSTQTLVEGHDSALKCKAEGNPAPTIECTKDGRVNTWQNIGRNDSGSFICTASNFISSVVQLVSVSVEYKPTVTLDLEGAENIKKGDNLTLTCEADGLPTPTYSWLLPPGANVIYSLDNKTVNILSAKRQDSGSYTCVAKNQHGEDSQQKQIDVSDNLPIILGAVLGSAAAVACIAALVAYYLYQRATKIRKYELQKSKQKAKQSTKSENLIPPESKLQPFDNM